MLKHGEKPAPDHDQWLSCYECGNTFPRHETFVNSKIKDSLETVNNPFEGNESIFLSIESRKEQWRKKRTDRRKRKYQDEDADIQREIEKGNTVRIL